MMPFLIAKLSYILSHAWLRRKRRMTKVVRESDAGAEEVRDRSGRVCRAKSLSENAELSNDRNRDTCGIQKRKPPMPAMALFIVKGQTPGPRVSGVSVAAIWSGNAAMRYRTVGSRSKNS